MDVTSMAAMTRALTTGSCNGTKGGSECPMAELMEQLQASEAPSITQEARLGLGAQFAALGTDQ